jgi:hypothetical protein
MKEYPFLVLSALFVAPGAWIYARRADLRGPMRRVAAAALPFALTERLFYGDYWKPKVLWDLIERVGCSVEDVLFVVGLGAFASMGYPWARGLGFAPRAAARSGAGAALLGAALLLGAFAVVGLALGLGAAILPASLLAMLAVWAGVLGRRPDLAWPSLQGGALTAAIYGALCVVFAQLVPGVFGRVWNPAALSGLSILGVPVEELAYAAAAGLIATVFYPAIFDLQFVKQPPTAAPSNPEGAPSSSRATRGDGRA